MYILEQYYAEKYECGSEIQLVCSNNFELLKEIAYNLNLVQIKEKDKLVFYHEDEDECTYNVSASEDAGYSTKGFFVSWMEEVH